MLRRGGPEGSAYHADERHQARHLAREARHLGGVNHRPDVLVGVGRFLGDTARDTASGKSQSIRISGSTRLASDAKQRMIDEAERYAEEDQRRREEAEQLNDADATCYQAEKLLADFADKLTEEMKTGIEAARRATQEACTRRDAAAAKEKADALKKLSSRTAAR